MLQRPFSLRWPFVNFGTILASVLLMALSFTNAALAQPETQEPEVVVPVRKLVQIKINNPNERELKLHFLDRWGGQPVKTFRDKTLTLTVQEGKYFLVDTETNASYPVPARFHSKRLSEEFPLVVSFNKPHEIDKANKMAFIPAGPALIGDALGVGSRDEKRVTDDIGAFWIAQYEVTNAEYVAFLNAKKTCDEAWLDMGSRKCRISKTVRGTFSTDAERLPVVMVSHAGAEAYCQWLTEKTGKKHRLPTEIEWEKAARGPYSWVYSYGDRYNESWANQESGMVSEVGKFRPSPWGLYDMTGNVFEWMSNEYDPWKPQAAMNQALRGGSFVLDGMYLRNSFRMRQSPSVMTDDIGFRVVREVEK